MIMKTQENTRCIFARHEERRDCRKKSLTTRTKLIGGCGRIPIDIHSGSRAKIEIFHGSSATEHRTVRSDVRKSALTSILIYLLCQSRGIQVPLHNSLLKLKQRHSNKHNKQKHTNNKTVKALTITSGTHPIGHQ